MVQAINEVKTDGNFGIGIVADGDGATYFGTDPRIESITRDYNSALIATRVFKRKYEKAGGPYPALSIDSKKLISRYSSCAQQIIELGSVAPDEHRFVLAIYNILEELEASGFILYKYGSE